MVLRPESPDDASPRLAADDPITPVPRLQERRYAGGRVLLRRELFAPDLEPPGGESWATFHARVDRAWEAILAADARTEGDLAVVTHGLVCLSITTRRAPRSFSRTAACWASSMVCTEIPVRHSASVWFGLRMSTQKSASGSAWRGAGAGSRTVRTL